MIRAYDEMYIEGAMIRMGDMLEYACLDCGYDPDIYWELFIQSGLASRFEVGDVSLVAGRSGPELAYMVFDSMNDREECPSPSWREARSDLYWSGWVLAYFQWHTAETFAAIWKKIRICAIQKMYPALHQADILKAVECMSELMDPAERKSGD